MPTYEYLCEKCDHEFEREQRISDPPVKTCPECRSRKVKKLISRTSFGLKGGGWYSDLYSSSKKDDASSKDSSKDSESTKSESASETKSTDTKGDAPSGKKSDKKSEKSGKKGKSAA